MYLNYRGGSVIVNGSSVSSDDRIKFNEKNIENGLEIIRKLSPEKYIKRLPYQEDVQEAGFIAQEVIQIPDLSFAVIEGEKEYIEGDPNTKYHNLNYNSIFTYGIAGIKELDNIVSTQQATITALEERIKALEHSLNK